jgi:hypothetical protein
MQKTKLSIVLATAIIVTPAAVQAQTAQTTTPEQQSTPAQAPPAAPEGATPAAPPSGNDLPPVTVIQKSQLRRHRSLRKKSRLLSR